VITGQLYINDKPAGHGFDSAPRVRNDEAFCKTVTGLDGVKDCSFEGLPNRAHCEMQVMGGCPVWEFQKPGEVRAYRCHDDQSDWASCDHFGSPNAQDDPQTPDFEGQPLECGAQRWGIRPDAGFFTVAHGVGNIRACIPNDLDNCGPWRPFNH
jgi:hypothetical protein